MNALLCRALLQQMREKQKQQFLQKKKMIFGDGQRTGNGDDDRLSLDRMQLDGNDMGGDYDPFAMQQRVKK